MDYLARREHGVQEITRKLINHGFDDLVVEAAVDALVDDGLLSDSRFTEAFIHSRLQRGSGPQKIRAELRQRGISEDLISLGMEAVEEIWRERVREVREKKFGAAMPPDFRERNRQMRFLQQRGFTRDQIYSAFRDDDS
jgi:regulatory protein